jgi:hypothetical protein
VREAIDHEDEHAHDWKMRCGNERGSDYKNEHDWKPSHRLVKYRVRFPGLL